MDPHLTKTILASKVPDKLYDDALSEPAKETGGLLTDTVKTVRLFALPLHALGNLHDRLKHYLDIVISRVPEQRQIPAPAHIAGPILESLKYIEEDYPLKEQYLNLLSRSIDSERQNEIHPSFVKIIDQLSRDEVLLLDACGCRDLIVKDVHQAQPGEIEKFT